jgi:tetratricopeptide (TPR) repeat protein
MEILEEAITLSSGVLDKKAFSNHDWPLWLAVHGNLLALRFRAQGSIDDVQDAVRVTTEAVSADIFSQSATPYVLTANAHCLRTRFEISARLEDIDRAIELANKAVEATQEKASSMPDSLLTLSTCLSNRSVITGTLADLHHAIEAAKSAVQLTPTGSIHWVPRMEQLSRCYAFRHCLTRSASDLNGAIRTITMAIDETPDYRPEKPRLISVKATHLYHRSLIGGNNSRIDQDEALELFQRALELLPQGSVDRVQSLILFGCALMGRFFESRAIADGDRSIETLRQSLCEIDSNDPSFTGVLNSLGMSLIMRFATQQNSSLKDLEDAVSYFTQCFRNHYGDGQHIERIQGAMGAADILCYLGRPQEATEILQDAIASLPLVTSQSLPQLDQQILLKGVSGLATSVAAVALEAGASAAEALMLLERGRGIIAGLLMGPQPADMEMLDVETDAAFMQARERLQTLSAGGRSVLDLLDMDESLARSSHILHSKALREAEEELLTIVRRIQENPNTKGFLKPPSESEVLRVLNDDTIVVVNEDNLRCDALILSQSVGTRLVPLKKLHSLDIRTRLDGLTSSRPYTEPTLLEWLWDVIAQPVLNELGFCEPSSDGHPPRISWIMTGSLHPFPTHAAGLHINGSRNTVIDRVMSSCASSLRSFVSGRSKSVEPLEVSQTKQALLVSMRQTSFRPDLPDLPLAVEEIDKLETLTSKLGLETIRLDCPDRTTLLKHLESCTFFHFAGHGESDPLDPSCSGLMLKDSLITVNDLQGGLQGQSNLVQHDAFLSYLSACLTGANDAVGLEDENIHTIGAFQLSGFHHVIGAQLQVFDATCSLVAESVYKNLTSNPLTDLAVCASLHFAVKQARDVWLSGLSGTTETREPPSETSEERNAKSLDKLTWIVDNQSFKMLINRNGRLNLQRKQSLKHIKAEWISYVQYGP